MTKQNYGRNEQRCTRETEENNWTVPQSPPPPLFSSIFHIVPLFPLGKTNEYMAVRAAEGRKETADL